jgi:hypothetical protein
MKKLLILALLAVLVIASCKKDKDDVQQIEPVPQSADYALFNTGSYWIYHWYKIDTLGNETFMDKTDSLYIAEDTIINGHTYQVKKGNFFVTQNYLELCRDSSNYIVSHLGQIMFSATNFTDIIAMQKVLAGFYQLHIILAHQIIWNKDLSGITLNDLYINRFPICFSSKLLFQPRIPALALT